MTNRDQSISNDGRQSNSSSSGDRRKHRLTYTGTVYSPPSAQVGYLYGPGPAQSQRPSRTGYLYGSMPDFPAFSYYGPGYGYSGPGYGWGYGFAGPPYGYGGNYWPGYGFESFDASYGPGNWFSPTKS